MHAITNLVPLILPSLFILEVSSKMEAMREVGRDMQGLREVGRDMQGLLRGDIY